MSQPTHLQDHIDLIAKHEQDFIERRTSAEKVADTVAGWMGSLTFISTHIAILLLWIGINTLPAARRFRFDPYPYSILDLIFAFEAILLASFVLMRQSRLGRRVEERNHLELQVLLLTEKELTALLGVCRAIAAHMGLKEIVSDKEIEQLSQHTPIDEVAQSIRENLTKDEA